MGNDPGGLTEWRRQSHNQYFVPQNKGDVILNTLESLLDNGIDEYTASVMLNSYSSKIGTMNGIYEITDITYDFKESGRDVTLKCTSCGREIHRLMVRGQNKWSKLIKTCPCQKEKKHRQKMEVLENLKNEKRALLENRVGNTYGDYTIISLEYMNGVPKYAMRCSTCGYERIVSAYAYDNLDFKCHKHYQKIKYDDSYIGRKLNFLTVTGIEYDNNSKRMFRCRCDCGSEKLYDPFHVVSEVIKSCGCMHDELLKTHGLSNTRLYRIWKGMNARCFDKKSVAYGNYGGRGITICEEWLGESGLFNFVAWAETHGYTEDLSIDRIDVNGNYEPSNCRWADDKTQLENRRPRSEWRRRKTGGKNKRRIVWTINGIEKSAIEWCEEFGMSYESVVYRINVKGMSILEALTLPKIADGRPRKAVQN